jgi:hypothetical protein
MVLGCSVTTLSVGGYSWSMSGSVGVFALLDVHVLLGTAADTAVGNESLLTYSERLRSRVFFHVAISRFASPVSY